ncbi:hypothetical protein [Nocardia asiatica]|uniref:hypothetical protein n=1 Tax=Nocardia asiatica TaxID=209252 RepID=UPI003EE11EE4
MTPLVATWRDCVIDTYNEYSRAAEYLHLLAAPMWSGLRPRLTAAMAVADPAAGVVVEFGAGTGLGTDVLLDVLAPAPIVVAEPLPHLRAVLLARLRDRDDGARVTVRPCGASELALPERISAAVGLHMIGHLGPERRRTLFAALVPRLTPGAPIVFNVQPPASATEPVEVDPYRVRLGGLDYEGCGHARPVAADRLRWTMTYRTLCDGIEIARASAEYDWWTLSAADLAGELHRAGAGAVGIDDDLVIAHAPA